MNEVIVLKEGYACITAEGKQKADGSIVLVKSPKTNILFDTGLPQDKQQIIKGLQDNGLTVTDINMVVCSHGHSDHVGNLGLFPCALIIVGGDICKCDTYYDNDLLKGECYPLDTDIDVVPTPGHTCSDVSLIVRNTANGTVLLSGDLFEKEADIENSDIWKATSFDPDQQAMNRCKMIQSVNAVVPGHGPMFCVTENHKAILCGEMTESFDQLCPAAENLDSSAQSLDCSAPQNLDSVSS